MRYDTAQRMDASLVECGVFVVAGRWRIRSSIWAAISSILDVNRWFEYELLYTFIALFIGNTAQEIIENGQWNWVITACFLRSDNKNERKKANIWVFLCFFFYKCMQFTLRWFSSAKYQLQWWSFNELSPLLMIKGFIYLNL